MNYNIIPTDNFIKEAKKLSKKYRSLYKDFEKIKAELQEKPTKGILIGNNLYKIRMAIKSKGKGKSGGARIIYYIYISEKQIFLMSVYDKSKKDNISADDINEILKDIKK